MRKLRHREVQELGNISFLVISHTGILAQLSPPKLVLSHLLVEPNEFTFFHGPIDISMSNVHLCMEDSKVAAGPQAWASYSSPGNQMCIITSFPDVPLDPRGMIGSVSSPQWKACALGCDSTQWHFIRTPALGLISHSLPSKVGQTVKYSVGSEFATNMSEQKLGLFCKGCLLTSLLSASLGKD
jgi:hypothetical protein